jgi:hypothetical protein
MAVLLEGSPISIKELWSSVTVTIGFLVASPTNAFLPQLLRIGRAACSMKSLGGSKLLPFKNDGGHCVLWDLQCYRNVLVSLPRSVRRHNHVSELCGQCFRPHGLDFALTCTVNCGTSVCLFKSYPINWVYYRWTPIKL